jgi:hypothetical protein
MDILWLFIVGVALAFFYFRYVKPEKIAGGGEIKPVDMEGFTVASPYVDRPLLHEINENKFYKLVAYRLMTKKPRIKYAIKVKQADEVGGIVDNGIHTAFIEEIIDDKGNMMSNVMPSNEISCIIPNKPANWFFSLTGEVTQASPLAKREIETKNRIIEDLKREKEQIISEQKNEVKDVINMAAKYSAGLKPPTFMPQM